MVHLYWILPDGTREGNNPQPFSSLKGAMLAAERFFAKTRTAYSGAEIVDPDSQSIVGTVKNGRLEGTVPSADA